MVSEPGTRRFSKTHWAVKLALHGRKFDSCFRMHRGRGTKKLLLSLEGSARLALGSGPTPDVKQPEARWPRI